MEILDVIFRIGNDIICRVDIIQPVDLCQSTCHTCQSVVSTCGRVVLTHFRNQRSLVNKESDQGKKKNNIRNDEKYYRYKLIGIRIGGDYSGVANRMKDIRPWPVESVIRHNKSRGLKACACKWLWVVWVWVCGCARVRVLSWLYVTNIAHLLLQRHSSLRIDIQRTMKSSVPKRGPPRSLCE